MDLVDKYLYTLWHTARYCDYPWIEGFKKLKKEDIASYQHFPLFTQCFKPFQIQMYVCMYNHMRYNTLQSVNVHTFEPSEILMLGEGKRD